MLVACHELTDSQYQHLHIFPTNRHFSEAANTIICALHIMAWTPSQQKGRKAYQSAAHLLLVHGEQKLFPSRFASWDLIWGKNVQ